MLLISIISLSVFSPFSTDIKEEIKPALHAIVDPVIYASVGTLLGTTAILSEIGWGICKLTPWSTTFGNEFYIAGKVLGIAAWHSFTQSVKKSPVFSIFFPSHNSHAAWLEHKKILSQIPISSPEDHELISFLQKRWLAKMTGCYPFLIDWMCPSFGIHLQVHPESTNSYARLPGDKFSDTYKKRIQAWKHFLPHPHEFPLVLTRPTNISDYYPKTIVDLTDELPKETLNRAQWLQFWNDYKKTLSHLDPSQIICIQRVQQKDIGGIRLLPLDDKYTEKHHQIILDWVSQYGLSANRIELDRPFDTLEIAKSKPKSFSLDTKTEWVTVINSFETEWKSDHPQKTLMFKSALQILKDFCVHISDSRWEEIQRSPTLWSAAKVSFKKIKKQFQKITREEIPFYQTISCIEQIFADISSLLEIYNIYTPADFANIFRNHLTCIPQNLQPLTGYGIHSSGMTSLGGIFKAMGNHPKILYGENAYFECIHAAESTSAAKSIQEATEEDWKQVDLILAQFNPTVKRINFKVTEYQATEYHVENISNILHKALKAKEGKPLTIALDGTLDFSDSPRVGKLLNEFQKEIEEGSLNVICYRSGLKFDLFGMDNYCGAPFFIIHNQDPKWASFDTLLTDPVLQTDRLSINWFCLAFQNTAPYLELYRKNIFDNTRAVLEKIPSSLYSENNPYYRVIPIDADAEASFIDIKIFGPMSAVRGGLLVGMYCTLKCMEEGHPLLFRPSIGFYHPNLAVLFGTNCTTVRLTLGLDPSQVDIIANCLSKIAVCNGN